jgi:hypothetical protein
MISTGVQIVTTGDFGSELTKIYELVKKKSTGHQNTQK